MNIDLAQTEAETRHDAAMNRTFFRPLLFSALGGLALLVLQWHFSHSWTSYYSRFPWPGYQQAMVQGRMPAFLTSSPRSLQVGSLTLLVLPLLTLWFASGQFIKSTLALWVGVMAALVVVWSATPHLRQDSNMWPIDLAFLGFWSAGPLLVGALAVGLIQKVRAFLGPGRAQA